MQYCVAFSLYG